MRMRCSDSRSRSTISVQLKISNARGGGRVWEWPIFEVKIVIYVEKRVSTATASCVRSDGAAAQPPRGECSVKGLVDAEHVVARGAPRPWA